MVKVWLERLYAGVKMGNIEYYRTLPVGGRGDLVMGVVG